MANVQGVAYEPRYNRDSLHHALDIEEISSEPPPSYEDATGVTAPLLAGQPPAYGTLSDASSMMSSEAETTDVDSLSEGTTMVLLRVIIATAVFYCFWRICTTPDP